MKKKFEVKAGVEWNVWGLPFVINGVRYKGHWIIAIQFLCFYVYIATI